MSADKLNEHESRGRGVYPRAGVEGLSSLNELDDFKIVDGEPDIRGWDLLGADRKKAGKVHDLLVDTAAMRVRYLDVELDRKAAGGVKDRHVLVPIGVVQLDDDKDEVRLAGGLGAGELSAMPEYDHDMINRDEEVDLIGRFGTLGAAATAGALAGPIPERDANFYAQPHFSDSGLRRSRAANDPRNAVAPGTAGAGGKRRPDDDSRYITRSEEELVIGRQSQQAGEAEVRKTVDTERVTRTVPVSHEEVTVERRPVRGDMRADARIGEDEIRVPLSEEEVVVEKRVVPKEEIVIKKHMVAGEKTVEADVRKERVDVDQNVKRDAERDRGEERR